MLTINNTLDGYLKDVEIKGNTIQDSENLANIRSVGDKVEGQELYEIPVLSCGKNLFNKIFKAELDKCNIVTVSKQGVITLNGTLSTHYFFKVVIPKGKYRATTFSDSRMALHVFWDGGDSSFQTNKTLSYTEDKTLKCYIASGTYDNHICKFQLEEGTQATEYEPYQEDKLTILSPTPLEKVGDVSDRLIEKDGVWGVEKNISTFNDFLNCTLNVWGGQNTDTGIAFYITSDLHNQNVNAIISNKFLHGDPASNKNNFVGNSYRTYILRGRVPKDGLSSENATGIKEYLHSIGAYVKYVVAQPQFIPLPHSQQVKLRTFANKTNISFLTEIEGTIKAQVPKSLGATVNTHTEQINNLNKELDRVKKLEESTVSTVTTESDFTTVEATTRGYFEDVKLEGKTLVNLAVQPTNNGKINNRYATVSKFKDIKSSTEYTYFIQNNSSAIVKLNLNNQCCFPWSSIHVDANSIVVGKAKSLSVISGDIWLSLNETQIVEQNLQVMLLEGDYTQKPLSYFEGLKSVGQDVDEIVVSSVNENLVLNCSFHEENQFNYAIKISDIKINKLCVNNPFNKEIALVVFNYNTNAWVRDIKVPPNAFINAELNFEECVRFINFPKTVWVGSYDHTSLAKYVIIGTDTLNIDKKRLLYYNTETQTWEKPILREWDSIEKHANGKYYYHQRSGDVVLNGSEDWNQPAWSKSEDWLSRNPNGFVYEVVISTLGKTTNTPIMCDKFNSESIPNSAGLSIGYCALQEKYLSFATTAQSTIEQWKSELQANNVTVVYQLAKEKVYECTNIDLITYANETNFIVESGVLSPKTTLKVHNNISNVVSLLQKKVSLLESNMTKYMITQNRLQLSSTHSADSVTFKVDYTVCSENMSQENYDTDLYNLILNNILVGKDNYNYDHMFNIIMDYASWSQISWDQFDILVGLMDIQHNPPIEEIPTDDEIVEEIPNEIM